MNFFSTYKAVEELIPPLGTKACRALGYLPYIPPTGRVWHKVGPDVESKPTYARCFLESRRHSSKKRHLRRQGIKPTPPERVRTWKNGLLRLKDVGISRETRMLGLLGTHVGQPQPTSTKPRHTRSENASSRGAPWSRAQVDVAKKESSVQTLCNVIQPSETRVHALCFSVAACCVYKEEAFAYLLS